jgi:hypothetical protein
MEGRERTERRVGGRRRGEVEFVLGKGRKWMNERCSREWAPRLFGVYLFIISIIWTNSIIFF